MKFLFASLLVSVLFHVSYAQEKYLLVGSGGGVVGTATMYKITPDGKVLKGAGLVDIDYSESAKLKKCRVKKYFKGAKSVMAPHESFNHPGNMYSTMTLVEEGHQQKVTWGDASTPAPEEVKKLYEQINARLSRLTFIPDNRK